MNKRLWNRVKTWNSISIGPLAVLFRLARATKVSSNFIRRRKRRFRKPPRVAANLKPEVPIRPVSAASSAESAAPSQPTALIIGTGPGFGYALAETLSAAGFRLALAARNAERLDPLVDSLRTASGLSHYAYGCDATMEKSVQSLFQQVTTDIGSPDLVVYAVQGFDGGRALDVEVCAFENSWRQNCLGAFIAAREAGRAMVAEGKGTIVLVGSTSGMIGRADHLCLSVGKFGMRAISQVMARELWPKGIHVVHCVIDGDIKEPGDCQDDSPQSNPEDIAAFVLGLHRQPRSAWTSEADLRPFNERFWEHC